MAYGVQTEERAYLSVFAPKTDTVEIPLQFEKKSVRNIKVLYPSKGNCQYQFEEGVLKVQMPQEKAARLFCIELR